MLPGNSTSFVYKWTEQEEWARCAALRRSGKALSRRALRHKAWDAWGVAALSGGLLILFLLALLYVTAHGLAAFPQLLHGIRNLPAALPSPRRSSGAYR